MTTKGKRGFYLHLAIVCFVGIIAVFVIDGYLGVYDTFYVTAGEHEQEIAPDYWLRSRHNGYSYPFQVGAEWGQAVYFRYEIDNRCFSSYSTFIYASLWKEDKKLFDLFSGNRTIAAFHRTTVEWALDSDEFQSRGLSVGEYTMKVERAGIERKIIVAYYVAHSELVYPAYPLPSAKIAGF
jgi:hypothetical protein